MKNSPSSHSSARPLRVMFINTSLPVGGAEMLELNLVRRLDRTKILPEVCCLKEPGPLGKILAAEVSFHAHLIGSKYDVSVLWRLARLFRQRQLDAIVTVGAGDKMFWGRLAARLAGVPVVISALHSTGWPDGVSRLNRLLTPITDALVAVAEAHGRFLMDKAHFPASKVRVIPNGVDTTRFSPGPGSHQVRHELGIDPADPVVGIVAALRPEKNHSLFLEAAERTVHAIPDAKFLIVGDGPERERLGDETRVRRLEGAVRFLGTREDIPEVLRLMDVFALTSHMEANPVSILEAMACGLPVVAPRVGSVAESVTDGVTGYLVPPGDAEQTSRRWSQLIHHPLTAKALGTWGRQIVVDRWSLEVMVEGYQDLIAQLYQAKRGLANAASPASPVTADIS